MELPQISGWPGKYPIPDPKKKALLVLNDLKALKKDQKLAKSHSFLSMFAKNALELDQVMDQLHHGNQFPKSLSSVNNWFKNAKENKSTLSETLFELKENHFRRFNALEHFISELTKQDPSGLALLIAHLEEYLKSTDI